jgi:hypothetical protein
VYGSFSPITYYSPGAEIGAPPPASKPPTSGGNESVHVPNFAYGGTLYGAYVWFEYGYWSYITNGGGTQGYYWHCDGVACTAIWVSNPSGGCFSEGTHVLTPNGSTPIEQLVIGDTVLSTTREKTGTAPVARRIDSVVQCKARLLAIGIGGETIPTTRDHSIYSKDKGWVRAAALVVGDLVRSHNGRWMEVESIDIGKNADVYNLVIDDKSTFFVGHEKWEFSLQVADGCGVTEPHPAYSPNAELAFTRFWEASLSGNVDTKRSGISNQQKAPFQFLGDLFSNGNKVGN